MINSKAAEVPLAAALPWPMVDAMNGPQDRENSAAPDGSMEVEKHHRHLRRTNELINA
jgi:hypothetical protein